jgi:glycosyltransferase involved in cell wall biosynthesis
MSLVSHAPPPGSRSGVADYAETLRPALEKLLIGGAAVHLYHLGNNRLHTEVYAEALRTAGVAVLHDAVLHHFFLGTLTREQYLAEWVYNYGEWMRPLGEELWTERARAGTDTRYFLYPMVRRVVEAAKRVIVHNAGAAALAREHGARDVVTIPHFFEPPPEPVHAADVAEFRRRIGVEPAATLFGIFGYLRETKRVSPTLASFRRLHAVRPEVALLVAGEPVSGDLERVLGCEAAHPAIRRLPHLSERELQIAAAAIDCGINLRYPAAGETSGIAIRLMGAGTPVIVSDIAENTDFPDPTVLRVSPGAGEPAELFAQMAILAGHPGLGREIGTRAAAHIRRHHSLDAVASRYAEALSDLT